MKALPIAVRAAAVPLLVLALLLLLTPKSSLAQADSTVAVATSSSYGSYLATPSGMPLYTYNGDSPGKSTVTGQLLAVWPPFTASGTLTLPAGVGGKLSYITRPDGSQQVAYNGLPLYTFVRDTPGNVTGQGVAGFSLAKPEGPTSTPTSAGGSSGAAMSTPYPAPSATPTSSVPYYEPSGAASAAPLPTPSPTPSSTASSGHDGLMPLLIGGLSLFTLAIGAILGRRR